MVISEDLMFSSTLSVEVNWVIAARVILGLDKEKEREVTRR